MNAWDLQISFHPSTVSKQLKIFMCNFVCVCLYVPVCVFMCGLIYVLLYGYIEVKVYFRFLPQEISMLFL